MTIKTIKHTIFKTAASAALLATIAMPVSADGKDCTTTYGGSQYGSDCPSHEIVINKEVKHPVNRTYVENLGTSDVLFTIGNQVVYRLTVKNTGNERLTDVEVTDILPPYVKYSHGGPSGTSYNPDDKTVRFTIDELEAGQSKSFELITEVEETDAFPSGRSVFCVDNTGRVEAKGMKDEDKAQICIETDILGDTTLPEAGVEDWMLLLGSGAIGLAGLSLITKKRTIA